MPNEFRRKVIAIIGSASASSHLTAMAFAAGKAVVDGGYRLANGGMFGVMEFSAQGARSSSGYSEGDIIGILPGYDPSEGNEFIDIPIPTGVGVARNAVLMSMCDAVIAIGGGAGTLSEIALAWQLKKLIVCLGEEGWHCKLKEHKIDHRRDDRLFMAGSPGEALDLISSNLHKYEKPFKGVERKKPSVEDAHRAIGELFPSGPLEVIGAGLEGYVFRGSQVVYKYFHSFDDQKRLYWMLSALSEEVADFPGTGFFDFKVVLTQGHLIAQYEDFDSTPYLGGEAEKVTHFLRQIHRLGWAMTNFKAENFRVNSEGVLLCIDLGRSFYPRSTQLFRQMCMRAFLTIHFPFHPSINALYSDTNTNDDFNLLGKMGEDAKAFRHNFNLFYNEIIAPQ